MPFEINGNDGMLYKNDKNEKVNITSGSGQQCRICWGTEDEVDAGDNQDFNPLISPCKCIGTVQAIHLKCLKEWLDTKRSMKIH